MKKIYTEPTTKPIELEPYSLVAQSLIMSDETGGKDIEEDDKNPDDPFGGGQW